MTRAAKRSVVWSGDYGRDDPRRQQVVEQIRRQAVADVTKATEAIRDRLRRDLAREAPKTKRPRTKSS